MKLEKRLTKNQRMQLIGLCTIARTKGNELTSIKEAFNEILGNPYLGEDMFWDIVWDSNNVVDMIDAKKFRKDWNVKELGKS